MLAALRFPVESSRGRRYPEPEHLYRNPFQRDRDRVVHSRAFRRLEAKTQVFTQGLSDHFRNRLTHTIEVVQIARTLANVLQLDEDLTEALALVHDIGHPPFGHAGEEELNRQMRPFGEKFDHNLHALRIVENFEQRYARFPGLNLTFEVREGMVKHSRDFERGEDERLDEYLPGVKPPLEAQLIDLADEVAYNTADLDDAFSAEMLSAEDVANCVPQYRAILESVEAQFPAATSRQRFYESLRQLIDALVSGLIEGTVQRTQEAGVRSVDDVRSAPVRMVAFTPEAAETSRQLKRLLHVKVYAAPALTADRNHSISMVGELFRFFLDNPGALPRSYQEQAAQAPIFRVVCDYIAGMTDIFFRRTYEQHLGIPANPTLRAL
ncbi:MAG: deoxyguanosinetriphosphate triphosphohydrolase [Terriglobia bacterium]|nr:MAG: deoxyguanosinetriphosphate triphosphohydrolase [Terriglobia bacterium]